MKKNINFKIENEKRKLKVHEKMKNGDIDEIRSFIEICTELDDDEMKIMDSKIENIIKKTNEEFSLDFIKSLDCKIIDELMFDLLMYTDHIKTIWQIGLYDETNDEDIYIVPLILQLEDDTEIKTLLAVDPENIIYDDIEDNDDNDDTDEPDDFYSKE